MDGEICDCIINLDPILRQAKLEAMPVERKKTAFKLSSTGERAGEPRGEVQVRTSTHRGDKETTGIGEYGIGEWKNRRRGDCLKQ